MSFTTESQLINVLDRVKDFVAEDIEMEYLDPTDGLEHPNLIERYVTVEPRFSFRLPSRLNSPLMNTGKVVEAYINSGFKKSYTGLEQNTLNYLYKIGKIITEYDLQNGIYPDSFQSNMECFLTTMHNISKKMDVQHGSELETLNNVSHYYAEEIITLDIKQSTMRDELFNQPQCSKVQIPIMINFLIRVRAVMTRSLEKANRIGITHIDSALGLTLTMTKDGLVRISNSSIKCDWTIFLADRWAMVYLRSSNYWNIVPMTYVDYYFTKVEILYNMDIVSSTPDHSDIRDLVILLNDLASMHDKHDQIVDFMKSYEGLLNMTADFKADSRCSVGSLLDVYRAMSEHDEGISGTTITIADYLTVSLTGDESAMSRIEHDHGYSILYRIAKSISKLSPSRMLEISSLHKFCFYAVIDEIKGVKKLAKRTHTPRSIDFSAIRQMRCYFNREYILTFSSRHRRLPQVLNNETKLRESDIIIEVGTTNFETVSAKYSELIIEYRKFGKLNRDTHQLDWWFNMRPYDCEEDLSVGTPIEHAKDKRSSKKSGTYTNFDTEKELEAIIRTESIYFRDLTKVISDEKILPHLDIIQQGSVTYDDCLTTILKEKEREQKKEGRLFGMLTTEGKQSLSRMMTKAEHVLSYFHGNLMTPQDSERKKTLHWMAQSLLDDDKYAIMADIEGHNQSMQHGNTADLLESIGLIYGENKWYKLSNLFSNLNLFFAQTYEDYTYRSKGQLGGIEGWMNPVWTLHTVIITSLLPELTEIDLHSKAVYSDDIALVITIPDLTDQTLNNTLSVTQDHFFRFGMILKALQTVVSKYRITMLRQHYIAGLRSDASLKRLISASVMGNQFFHCDEIESAGLVSAISSSLELSNTVYAQVRLKWIRLSQLLIRPFLSSITTEISSEIMNSSNFSEATISVYHSLFPYDKPDDYSWVFDRLKEELSSQNPMKVKEWINHQRSNLSIKSLSSSQLDNAKFQLLRLMKEDKSFIVLFLLRCLLPIDMGGVNSMFLEQMVLTGFRDSLSRTLSILKNLFMSGSKESNIVNAALSNVLGGNGKFERMVDDHDSEYQIWATNVGREDSESFTISYDESSLVSQEWPTSLRQITPNDMIKGRLLSLFKKICVNKELKDLLKFDSYRSEYRSKIVSELRKSFYSKIARFYVDSSGFMIVDKILGKVENTSSMIRRVNKFDGLCRSMSECAIKGPRKWLLKPIYNYGRISHETNIQEYLFMRRSKMFPMVNFVPCIEPEANSVIKSSNKDEIAVNSTSWAIQCTSTSGMMHLDGKPRYLPPLYGNEALYKGSLKDQDEMFSSLKEALLVKCVSITKWIIYRSDDTNYFKNVILSTNISNCADLALNTLGYGRFRTYQAHVPLLTRSEIAHRIPVLDQKPRAVLRCLPIETPKFKATFNQSWIYKFNLADSDIHFDYFKMRIICAESIATSLHEPINWSKHYNVMLNPLIRDVQFNYLYTRSEIEISTAPKVTSDVREVVSLTRIKWLTEALPAIVNGSSISSMPKVSTDDPEELPEIDLTKQLVIEYYKSIKSQYLWDYNPLWSTKAWDPFIKKYGGVLSSQLVLDKNTIQTIIMEHTLDTIQNLKSDAAPSNNNAINKAIIDRLRVELLSDDENIIDTCDRIIEMMSSISRSARNPLDKLRSAEEMMNLYGVQHDRLLHELFLRVVIENCISIRVKNGELSVDKFASISICEHMLVDMVVFLGPDTNKAILAGLILRNAKIENLRRVSMQIIEDAFRVVNNGELDLEAIDSSITKVKYDYVDKVDPELVKEPDSIQSRLYNISKSDLIHINNLPKILEYRSLHVMSRGDPIIYDSPLGSDIYATAYSILSSLVQAKVISHETIVLDLIAGRGEFNIALNKLAIKHYSMSRLDQYSAMRSSSDVNYIEEYDWASSSPPDEYYSLLSTIDLDKTLALFDISHLGKKSSTFIDRLLDVLPNHPKFLIRFKSVSGDLLSLMSNQILKDYTFFIVIVGEKGKQCPHPYLLGFKSDVKSTRLSDANQMNSLARRVVQDIRSVFVHSSSKFTTEEIQYCSLYEDFDLRDCDLHRVEELASIIINKGGLKIKSELLSSMSLLGNYYIPYMLIDHVDSATRTSWEDISIMTIDDIEDLINHGYTNHQLRSNSWDKCRSRPRGLIVQAHRLDHDSHDLLRMKHPVRELRKVAHMLFRLDISGSTDSIEEFSIKLENSCKSTSFSLTHWGPRSRIFYDSCLLLFGNSIHSDHQSHLDILRINYQLGMINRRQYHDLLKTTNLMSGIQTKFDEYMSNWAVEESIGREVMEEYYDQYVRKLNYHKEIRKVYKSESNPVNERKESVSESDSKLAKLFLESIDDVMDIDIISSSMIADSQGCVVDSEELISSDQINRIMNVGITGLLGDTLSGFVISEEVLKEDHDRLEQIRLNTSRFKNETDVEFEKRINTISLMASINDEEDDFYDEDDEY